MILAVPQYIGINASAVYNPYVKSLEKDILYKSQFIFKEFLLVCKQFRASNLGYGDIW
eukprot:c40918_g1_i1 orf=580-753(+)